MTNMNEDSKMQEEKKFQEIHGLQSKTQSSLSKLEAMEPRERKERNQARTKVCNDLYSDYLMDYERIPENVLTIQQPEIKDFPMAKIMKPESKIEKLMKQHEMNRNFLSFLCGTCFGDSSLSVQSGGVDARLTMKHSSRQREWVFWKRQYCETILKKMPSLTYVSKEGSFQENASLRPNEHLCKLQVQTKASASLTEIYKFVYTGRSNTRKPIKKLERSWLNHMNHYFLMALWLDDGSLFNSRQGNLSLNAIPAPELDVLIGYFKIVWKIKMYKTPKKKGFILNFHDKENLKKYLEIIAPIVPIKEMLYKICFYNSSNRLETERWKSERLKPLIRKEWHSHIDSIYQDLEAKS